jgi:hypothetical protein
LAATARPPGVSGQGSEQPLAGKGKLAGKRLEPLEDRCVPSADVVLEWDQALLDAAKANGVSPLSFTRDAAIVSAAAYDAVNDIDRSYTPDGSIRREKTGPPPSPQVPSGPAFGTSFPPAGEKGVTGGPGLTE